MRKNLEKILKLPHIDANIINEPARDVPIKVIAEIRYKFNKRSELVYIIGFDKKSKRLLFSPSKDAKNLTYTTNIHSMLISEVLEYTPLRRVN